MYIFSRKETFTDSELNNFQEMIINWATKFINLFIPIASTEMKYPKLHNWCCHIVDIIRTYATSSFIKKHHHRTSILGGLESSFTISNFDRFINEYKAANFLVLEAEKAFEVLIDSLNQYFDLIENITDKDVETTLVKWYTNALIGGIDTVRAKSNYYNAPAFSDIAINMNEEEAETYNTFKGACFAKILMLFSLKIPGHEEQELALVQLMIIQMFTIIAVDSIIEPVHVILHFEKSNDPEVVEQGIVIVVLNEHYDQRSICDNHYHVRHAEFCSSFHCVELRFHNFLMMYFDLKHKYEQLNNLSSRYEKDKYIE
uniref:Uncharacterized protein n=1 Tax=Rhizophagus irregularis (strain DAOM 181602 / DAOM 197198 / MUCL 43194) TaxID=747089 RepID=U9UMF9_RHIID